MSEVHTSGSTDFKQIVDSTRVVLLARDPNYLFAFWEISEEKKNSFISEFGSQLWDKSFPVLKVTNVSNNTSFYIRINDFSNNWYIYVPDADSLYIAELGRRVSDSFFIPLASSNYVATPSNSLSSNTAAYFINYKDLRYGRLDVDTGKIYETYNYKSHTSFISGISSPELFRMNFHQSILGVSSADIFGIGLAEHLGISSEFIIR